MASACPTATSCQIPGTVKNNPFMLAFDGPSSTYSLETLSSEPLAFLTSACPTSSICMSASLNYSGRLVQFRSTDAGATWSPSLLPAWLGVTNSMRCSSSTFCLLEGIGTNLRGAIAVTHDAGVTWTRSVVPTSVKEVVDVKCVSTLVCHGVAYTTTGHAILVLSTNGAQSFVLAPGTPSSVKELVSISCSSALVCVAVGMTSNLTLGAAIYTSNAGKSWHLSTFALGTGPLNAVDCVSATTCIAVGSSSPGGTPTAGMVSRTTNSGATWTTRRLGSTSRELLAISCSSQASCEVSGDSMAYNYYPRVSSGMMFATTTAGATWFQQALPARQRTVLALSCPPSGDCLAASIGLPPDQYHLPPVSLLTFR